MPGKQVSQATFDAIVREAIDDFGLQEKDALEDAMAQLRLAGVEDFSGLVTSVPAAAAAEHAAVRFAKALASSEDAQPAIVDFLEALAAADADGATELVGVAGAHGAVESLCKLIAVAADADPGTPVRGSLWPACDALARLCRSHELNRMRALRGGDALAVLRGALGSMKAELPATVAFAVAAAALGALRAVQRRSENAKQAVAADGGMDLLLHIADRAVSVLSSPDADKETQRAVCAAARGALGALRQLLVADDAAAAVSETFNRARVLAGEPSVMASGLRSLDGDNTLPEVARAAVAAGEAGGFQDAGGLIAEAVGAVRVCAVSDAIVQVLVDLRYPALAQRLLEAHGEDVGVARAATALLRNLAARDQCKTEVASFAPAVARRVREVSPPDQALVEHLAGFVASCTLRRPDIARQFAEQGLLDDVVRGMQQFSGQYPVLKAGCLALRNAASRDEEARGRVSSIVGVERAVRHAMKAFPGECDAVGYNTLWELRLVRDEEIRRDERYKMPDGMFSSKVVR